MTGRDDVREAVAVALAEQIVAVHVRKPSDPVDVSRIHRDLADAVLAAVEGEKPCGTCGGKGDDIDGPNIGGPGTCLRCGGSGKVPVKPHD